MIVSKYFCDLCKKEISKIEYWFATSAIIFGYYKDYEKYPKKTTTETIVCEDCRDKILDFIDTLKQEEE